MSDNFKSMKGFTEQEMYQFCSDNFEMAEKFVEVFLDSFINAENPFMEFFDGCMICYDKYNVGREIVLENITTSDDKEEIDYSLLEYKVKKWNEQLTEEILDGALEYIDDNDINLHM